MGSYSSKPPSKIVCFALSLGDLIHEIMNWVDLKTISSISRIHTGSSTAIFTYRFKPYHKCNYELLINSINLVKILYRSISERRLVNRSNYESKLASLNLFSIRMESVLYDPHLYMLPCLYSCNRLEVNNTVTLEHMQRAWGKSGIKSVATGLSIREPISGLGTGNTETEMRYFRDRLKMVREIGAMFPHVVFLRADSVIYRGLINMPLKHLEITSGITLNTQRFPFTLETLIISNMWVTNWINLSGLPNLQRLIIKDTDTRPLIRSVDYFRLPSFFLTGSDVNGPNTTWFSSDFTATDLNRFKGSNGELYLRGALSILSSGLSTFTEELMSFCPPLITGKYYEIIFDLQKYDKAGHIESINIETCSNNIRSAEIRANDDLILFTVNAPGETIVNFRVGLAYMTSITLVVWTTTPIIPRVSVKIRRTPMHILRNELSGLTDWRYKDKIYRFHAGAIFMKRSSE